VASAGMATKQRSTTQRIRTYNLRFRRPRMAILDRASQNGPNQGMMRHELVANRTEDGEVFDRSSICSAIPRRPVDRDDANCDALFGKAPNITVPHVKHWLLAKQSTARLSTRLRLGGREKRSVHVRTTLERC